MVKIVGVTFSHFPFSVNQCNQWLKNPILPSEGTLLSLHPVLAGEGGGADGIAAGPILIDDFEGFRADRAGR